MTEKMKNSSPKKLSADCWPTDGQQSDDSQPYDDAILVQFVVHHATDSNRTIRVECLRCHHTCQIFKCRFAVGQLSVNCWYTAGRQYTDRLLGELFFTFSDLLTNGQEKNLKDLCWSDYWTHLTGNYLGKIRK